MLGSVKPPKSNRRDDIPVVLNRLRIGHTWLTHSFLLRGEDAPECIPCFSPLSVQHIMIHCIDVAPMREKYFKVFNLSELFGSVPVANIFSFLKEIGIYKKI